MISQLRWTPMSSEVTLSPQSASRPETTAQIVRLTRFGILCTLALTGIVLIYSLLPDGRHVLTEGVVISLFFVISIEVVAAIAAITCLALWKKSE
jgi:hypothetical protein